MNKKRLFTELALWLAALAAAVALTGFDGWKQGHSRLPPAASAAPAVLR